MDTARRDNILLEMTKRLKRSGYKIGQIGGILVSGLRGYNSKWDKNSNRERHRRARDTEESRRLSKLIGKTTWFNHKPRATKDRQQDNQSNNKAGQKNRRRKTNHNREERPSLVQ